MENEAWIGYNEIIATRFRAGWIGFFSGENQSRALLRVIDELNARGMRCAGLVQDRWNPWVRLWWMIIAILTLGFYVRVPNVLVVAEPIDNNPE